MEEKTFFKYICVQIRVEKSIVRFLYLLLLSSSPADVSKMKQNSTAIKVATVKAIKTNWLDLHSRKHMQRRYSRLQDTTRFWHSTNTSLWFWNRCRNVWVGPLQLLSPPTRHSSSTREKNVSSYLCFKRKELLSSILLLVLKTFLIDMCASKNRKSAQSSMMKTDYALRLANNLVVPWKSSTNCIFSQNLFWSCYFYHPLGRISATMARKLMKIIKIA